MVEFFINAPLGWNQYFRTSINKNNVIFCFLCYVMCRKTKKDNNVADFTLMLATVITMH